MSKFILIFVLCVVTVSYVESTAKKEEFAKQAQMYSEECKKEVGATQSDIEEVTLNRPLTTRTASCFAACLMKKYNVMDKNGKFDKSAALEYMKNSSDGNEAKCKMAAEVLEICAKIPLPSDHCDASKALFECFDKHITEKAKH